MKTAALLLCYRLCRTRKQSKTPGPSSRGAKRTGRLRACLVPISHPLSTGRQAAVQVRPFGFLPMRGDGGRRAPEGPAGSEQELASEWRAGGLAAAA